MNKRVRTPMWYEDYLKTVMDNAVDNILHNRNLVDLKEGRAFFPQSDTDVQKMKQEIASCIHPELRPYMHQTLAAIVWHQSPDRSIITEPRMTPYSLYQCLFALTYWTMNGRPVYRFSKDAAIVISCADGLQLSKLDLNRLPANMFILEYIDEDDVSRIYFILKFEHEDGHIEIDIIPMDQLAYIAPSKLSDVDVTQENAPKLMPALMRIVGNGDPIHPTLDANAAKRVFNLLAYLTVDAADIELQHTAIDPSSEKMRRINKKKASDSILTHYEVGAVVRDAVRRNRAAWSSHAECTDDKRSIRPHFRQAHFHTYRVGPRTDWHYELRWIDAIFVNPDNDDPNEAPMSILEI